ncbi:MAG: acetyltransferase [Solirubrobacteraceae bacterium]|nr:acetyltransferase [Solirubrobacteraceae bacterium]
MNGWEATIGGSAVQITAAAIDPECDADLVSGWMNAEHVAPWWGLAGPVETTVDYLRAQVALPHLEPWLMSADGVPFAYAETYVSAFDPLARHYAARDGDRGFHLLIGPGDRIGTGHAQLLIRALIARLLADPEAGRVLCEPDVRNTRMLRCCNRLGARDAGILQLPDKTASLLIWTRSNAARRFGSDRASTSEEATA